MYGYFACRNELEQAVFKMEHERFQKSVIFDHNRPVDWGLNFLFSRDRVRVQTQDEVAHLYAVRWLKGVTGLLTNDVFKSILMF